MSDDVYTKLQEFLDKLPGGYPATESGVEIKILKKLYSPEDAELTLKLKSDPEEVPTIAKRIGMDESEAAEKLESMAKRGLIFRVRDGDTVQYRAFQYIVGIYEFQMPTIDRELIELMQEYAPHLGLPLLTLQTKQLRVVPVGTAVDALPEVATYNRIKDLVKDQELIAVQQCICRKGQGIMGNECTKPHENCISFGDFAQYGIDNGEGRQINTDEALKLLTEAEDSGLVLSPSNTQDLSYICTCCGCCCGVLQGLKMLPRPADFCQSYYQAEIDPELCTACGTCLERCQIDAIKENDDTMEIDLARCIGCGLCVPSCPVEAITLAEKPDTQAPPKDLEEMLTRISKERGLA